MTFAATPRARDGSLGAKYIQNMRTKGALMRDTFASIDRATKSNPELRGALYDLAAQQIAGQAFAVAVRTRVQLTEDDAFKLVDDVAGYAEITRTLISDSETTVRARALEIMMRLARLCPNFTPLVR